MTIRIHNLCAFVINFSASGCLQNILSQLLPVREVFLIAVADKARPCFNIRRRKVDLLTQPDSWPHATPGWQQRAPSPMYIGAAAGFG